eukprot:CAMPEP_0206228590 /NCGR_PEP_ID=MMETSP0047_2-20121206/9250_1 /ASSEMBLY_ACC=CAM_ASM_000192 /TAXON_ID=195065 /ORGANISM="Chroomonas mesostigmatica_cf, Strain CCMP1168" /LENGTH=364 /DNA_ID=CAMNT_0053651843 /DNA_START=26 /DNA_END=1120 /DNA_ORIENTATION=-
MTASSESTPLMESGRARSGASRTLRKAAIAVAGLAAVALVGVVSYTRPAHDAVTTELLTGVWGPAQESILKQHNAYRCMHGVPAMTWDTTLAFTAQQYAQMLAFDNGCQMKHSRCDSSSGTQMNLGATALCQWGENLAWASAPFFYDAFPAKMVDAWYAEDVNYDYATQSKIDPAKPIGHFTQVVWKGSTRIGCGAMECRDTSNPDVIKGAVVTVCHYLGPGNINTQYAANVPKPIKTKEECQVMPTPNLECPDVKECSHINRFCFNGWSCGNGKYTCGDAAKGGCQGKVDPATVYKCEVFKNGPGCKIRVRNCQNQEVTVKCTPGRGILRLNKPEHDYEQYQGCASCDVTKPDGSVFTLTRET